MLSFRDPGSFAQILADTNHLQIKDRGITSLWSGALTGAAVSFVEHYFVSDRYLGLHAEADFDASGLRRITILEGNFQSSTPKIGRYCDRRSSGFALP